MNELINNFKEYLEENEIKEVTKEVIDTYITTLHFELVNEYGENAAYAEEDIEDFLHEYFKINKYDTVIIIKPDTTEEEIKTIEEDIIKLINTNGKIEDIDRHGKIKLAYKIKNYENGIFTIFTCLISEEIKTDLEKYFRETDNIIKYLIARYYED